MRAWTLRLRMTLAATAAIGLVLVVAGVVLVHLLEHRLAEASDDLARARATELVDQAEQGILPRRLEPVGEEGVAQVVTASGRVLGATPNVAGQLRIATFDTGPDARVVEAPDDDETETYRLVAVAGTTPDGTPVVAYVGSGVEAVSEAVSTLRRSVELGVPALTLLLGLVAWWAVGRALRRLDRMRAEVDAITDPAGRVDGGDRDDEVGRLARTLNAMLERVDDATRRQRDLVADVSHDLRTPLAAQRLAVELALRDPAHVDAVRLREEVLGATSHLERLVADLLLLAAEDAGTPTPAPRPFDLDELVREEVALVAATTATKFDLTGLAPTPAFADPDGVRRAVRNLLDNAADHATGVVTVATRGAGGRDDAGWARCVVADDGPGIEPAERERIFERFHRGDAARHGGGTGLGLAIARSLARRDGGDVTLAEPPAGASGESSADGARFVLDLPAPAVPQPSAPSRVTAPSTRRPASR